MNERRRHSPNSPRHRSSTSTSKAPPTGPACPAAATVTVTFTGTAFCPSSHAAGAVWATGTVTGRVWEGDGGGEGARQSAVESRIRS